MSTASNLNAQLDEHPALFALCARLRAVTARAFEQRRPQLLSSDEVAEIDDAALPSLSREQAETSCGNVLEILDRGARSSTEWSLLSALWARGSGAAEPERAQDISEGLWLATQTPLCPLLAADGVWPAPARSALWRAVGDACANAAGDESERLALAVSLSLATSSEAVEVASELVHTTQSPVVQALLSPSVAAQNPLRGEVSTERGRFGWTVLALSGLLFVLGIFRLGARTLLGLRRQGALALSPGGLSLTQSTSVLGKRVRTVDRFLPFGQVTSIRRETRYANAALYVGLFALAMGTYIGTGLLADSLRAPGGSPSLFGLGLLAIALGVALDFVLFRLSTRKHQAARLVIELRKGPSLVLRGPELSSADDWLRRVNRLMERV